MNDMCYCYLSVRIIDCFTVVRIPASVSLTVLPEVVLLPQFVCRLVDLSVVRIIQKVIDEFS